MKMLLLGDVCPTDVTNPLFHEKKVEELFSDTLGLFQGNDLNFVNLECALTESDQQIKKFGPCLKATPVTAEVLHMAGVNCCGLSNNHIFDYGIQGAEDTMATLDRVGIPYTGFGNNLLDSRKNFIKEVNGERVCIITVCEHEYSYALEDRMGSRPFDPYDTLADIRNAKESADRVIVIYHGGKEFCAYPSPRLYQACHAMADSGADVILCQHSHCIGCYETYHDCHILYGQGNFHFVKPHPQQGWHSSLAVHYDSSTHEMLFTPLVSGEHSITLAKGEDKEQLLQAFAQRNEELMNGTWKDGWHQFCVESQEQYLGVISRAFAPCATQHDNDFFAHYLDCEAHTDVWRELIPTANQTNET